MGSSAVCRSLVAIPPFLCPPKPYHLISLLISLFFSDEDCEERLGKFHFKSLKVLLGKIKRSIRHHKHTRNRFCYLKRKLLSTYLISLF